MTEFFVIKRQSDNCFWTDLQDTWPAGVAGAAWFEYYPDAVEALKRLPNTEFYQVEKYFRP